MMKLPFRLELSVHEAPPVKLHVPATTPLLSVPVVVVVPFDVPVKLPVIVRVFPGGLIELTVKFNVPVTWFVELVVKSAEPDSFSTFNPVAKHAPELINPKPVISRGPLLVTEKAVTKFSLLASPVPPVSRASQLPLADVLVTLVGVLLPQLETAKASASNVRNASFFMYRP